MKDYTSEIFGGFSETAPVTECAFKSLSEAQITQICESIDPELIEFARNVDAIKEGFSIFPPKIRDKKELDEALDKVAFMKSPDRWVNWAVRIVLYAADLLISGYAAYDAYNQIKGGNGIMGAIRGLGIGALGHFVIEHGEPAVQWVVVKIIKKMNANVNCTAAQKIATIKSTIAGIDKANAKALDKGNKKFSEILVRTKDELEIEMDKVRTTHDFY